MTRLRRLVAKALHALYIAALPPWDRAIVRAMEGQQLQALERCEMQTAFDQEGG